MSAIMKVLVVDDDPMQLAMIERALPPQFFDVKCAATVGEMLAAGPTFAPHVVLADVNMPDLVGTHTVVGLAREAMPRARIVIYSAWEDSRLRGLAAELGADSYISKSASVIGIGTRLRELYGR